METWLDIDNDPDTETPDGLLDESESCAVGTFEMILSLITFTD